jgi:hypothetical protein
MSYHAARPIRDQLARGSANRRKRRSHPGADMTDLLLRVAELARDPALATPETLERVRAVLAWADQAQIQPGSVAAAAVQECRRLISETEHLRDRF